MVLSQSERISQLLDNSRKYVSRNKVRDSSELHLIHQAKGSSTSVPSIVQGLANPASQQIVPNYQYANDCAAVTYFTGVGTNDQTAILYNKQKKAICADDDASVNPYIILPVPKCSNIIVPVKPDYGGSLYFDGVSTDGISRLTIPQNDTDFQLDSSHPDFTIEWFQYATPGINGSAPRIFSIGNSEDGELFSFYETYSVGGNNVEYQFWVNGDTYHSGFLPSDLFNKWVHFAIESYQGTSVIYINGVGGGSFNSDYTVVDAMDDLFIGANYNYAGDAGVLYKGYLTNFRWTKGIAVYQGDFTVPNKPLTPSANTVLLLDVSSPDTYIDDTSGAMNTVTNVGVVYNIKTPFH